MSIYLSSQLIFLVFCIIGLPCYILWRHKGDTIAHPLGLPKGSVRSLLGIALVGSFLITVSLGPLFMTKEIFTVMLPVFSSIVSSAVTYYFTSRTMEEKKI